MREMVLRAGLAVAGIAVALLLGEAASRWLLPHPETGNFTAVPHEIRRPADHPFLAYTLRPGAVVKHSFPSDPRGYFGPDLSVTYRINALGFRGPETTRQKPAGRRRLVMIGDSFTFGTGVEEGDTFSAGLGRRLEERVEPERYEVLNLGVMGYNTLQEVALLETFGLAFEPDLVLVVFFLNDARGGGTHTLFNRELEHDARPGWRRASSLLDRIASIADRRRRVEQLAQNYRASFAEDSPTWQRARRALLRAQEMSERAGARMAIAVFPVLWQLSGDYPFEDSHRAVLDFAGGHSIPAFDLRPAFAAHHGPELWVHPVNQHPNEIAHDLAAEALYGFLESAGLLAQP